jgi:hypothetical protein
MPWDDEYDDDPCWHEEVKVDILNGRAHCDRCGESWYASDADIQAQIEHEIAYQAAEAEWNRWRRWNEFKDWLWSLIPRRRTVTVMNDDDIPF